MSSKIRVWDRRMLSLAELVASWSKDPRTKVGAVIADTNFKVCGIGYNGFPRGVIDGASRLADHDAKHACTVHAEVNAIHNASLTEGCTIYTTLAPCPQCMAQIIQAGIIRVIYGRRHDNIDYTYTDAMAREAKVILEQQHG